MRLRFAYPAAMRQQMHRRAHDRQIAHPALLGVMHRIHRLGTTTANSEPIGSRQQLQPDLGSFRIGWIGTPADRAELITFPAAQQLSCSLVNGWKAP